jgi:acetyl esterase/lipase
MKNLILIVFLLPFFNYAQPRDTSFTIYNEARKVAKNFPNAKLVRPNLPKGVTQKKDIVYISYKSRKMHFDLFSPPRQDKLFPAVLLIHGGGWRSGNKEMETPMAQFLASHGYIAATVEYRLSPEASYPASLIDIKSAIKWLRSNSNKYHIDTNKIALYGCSSGGQLVALLGMSNESPVTEKLKPPFKADSLIYNHSAKIQAVIDVDGVLDMTDPNESGKDTNDSKPSAGKYWLGYSYSEKPALWKEASPINYANAKSTPVCFINSSIPRFHAGRDELIFMLNKLGVYSEVHTIPNTPHTFWLFHPWFEIVSDYILKFLDKQFLPR